LNAAPIQHIGKLLVMFRPAPRAHAELPTAGRAKTGTAAEALDPTTLKGRAPRVVKVVKPSDTPLRSKPKKTKVVVRGNERVTAGGTVKRAKVRQASAKRQYQSSK